MTDKWNGQGLPPVGEVCKITESFGVETFREGKIKFIGDDLVVFENYGKEYCRYLNHVTFEPLKSEAERKRDEQVQEMIAIGNPHTPWIKNACKGLHDAGYRKVNELTDEQIVLHRESVNFCRGAFWARRIIMGEES